LLNIIIDIRMVDTFTYSNLEITRSWDGSSTILYFMYGYNNWGPIMDTNKKKDPSQLL